MTEPTTPEDVEEAVDQFSDRRGIVLGEYQHTDIGQFCSTLLVKGNTLVRRVQELEKQIDIDIEGAAEDRKIIVELTEQLASAEKVVDDAEEDHYRSAIEHRKNYPIDEETLGVKATH